jgi:rhodanese-related sulfurtransferase
VAKTRLPGHTVDGLAFLVGELSLDGRMPPDHIRWAFCGDTLLIGGIGRTDFYSSSAEDLLQSLSRLPRIIQDSTVVCPTHDYTNGFATTLAAERSQNCFLARTLDQVAPPSLEQFVTEKAKIDSRIEDESNSELVCGLIQPFVADKSSMDIHPAELKDFLATRPTWSVVDVREPHECRFSQPWESLGLSTTPENVPLTRLSDFLTRLLHEPRSPQQQNLIFVCRSGNRSGRAAEVARRLGFGSAWHLAGGIALGFTGHSESSSAVEDDAEYVI